jgi:hypothetical protein
MPVDLVDLLVAGHRRLESLLADVETAPTPELRAAALAAALDALARHGKAEREFLHPVLRECLPAGPEIADYERAEHDSIARDAAGCARDAVPSALFDAVRLHMQEEETELFPRLRQSCPPDRLLELGSRLEASRVTE